MANDNLIGRQESWLLTMEEIRTLRPDWPEQLVQDYFSRGREIEKVVTIINNGGSGEANTASNIGDGAGLFAQKVGVDLQFKSLTHDETIEIIEFDDEVFLRAIATTPPDDDCLCIEIITPPFVCTAVVSFAAVYGGYFAFLTRNYLADAGYPVGTYNGTVSSAVPGRPSGDFYDQGASSIVPATAAPYDSCGNDIFSWFGNAPPNTGYKVSGGYPVDWTNTTWFAVVRASDENGGVVFKQELGAGGAGAYEVRYIPDESALRFLWGNPFDSDNRVEFDVSAPLGWSSGAPRWAILICNVVITSSSVIMTSWVGDGVPTTVVRSSSDGGDPLNTVDGWAVGGSGQYDAIFGRGSTAGGRGGFSGAMLWTGIFAGTPSTSLIENMIYEVRRNQSTWVPAEEDPPPSGPGYVLSYDPDTGLWSLVPPFPGGLIGQFLQRTGVEATDVTFVDLPKELPLGGTTGQQLVKASDDDGDVEWVQRDAKTFFDPGDPSLTNTVYPGDFWLQAPPI